MSFDTGSHLTWVADAWSGVSGLPLYYGSKSTTYKDWGKEFKINYADGSGVLGKYTNGR
jgi:hypothetical protein